MIFKDRKTFKEDRFLRNSFPGLVIAKSSFKQIFKCGVLPMKMFRLVIVALLFSFAGGLATTARAEDPVSIKLGDGALTMTVPASWKVVQPRNRIIEHEFQAPKEGDTVSRITIMAAGGSIDANVDRWLGQFSQPDGKPTKDVAKVEKKKVGDYEVTVVDISGTMSESMGGGPFAPGKTVKREGYRMLGAIIDTKDHGLQFIKLTGAGELVEQQKKDFDAFIESAKPVK
jgi:hypothetical protein